MGLPPRFRAVVPHDQPLNEGRDSLSHWLLEQQGPAPWFSLFHLAMLERRIVGWLTWPIAGPYSPGRAYNFFKNRLARLFQKPKVSPPPVIPLETPQKRKMAS